MGFDSVNGFSRSDETPEEPSSEAFYPGDTVWEYPPGFSYAGFSKTEKPYGIEAYGATGAEGELRLVYNDTVIATRGPGDHYSMIGIPAGALDSESYPDRSGDSFVEMKTESGGVAQTPLSSAAGSTHFSPTFGKLVVHVLDANGDRVPKAKVGVGTTTHSTDSQGQVVVQAGGTVNVSALFGTVDRDVTLDENTDKTLSFQFHGVDGKVRTPTGGPIGGATVYLALSDGSVFAKTTSEDDGTFEFPTVPIDYGLTIASDPFARDFKTGKEGEWTTKNLPFDLETVGGVELDLTEKDSGDPIAGLPTSLKGAPFAALSTSEGEAALIEVFDSQGDQSEVEVTLGEDDPRYRTQEVQVVMVAGDTVTAQVDLERETAVVNT